jgi:galactonate dehydratase
MKIAAIETFAVHLDRDQPAAKGLAGSPNALLGDGHYRWSKDYPCLYSTRIESALVKVTLDNGLSGWGEAQAPLAPEVACTIIETLLRPALLGEPFAGATSGIAALWERMYSTMRVRGQTGGFMLDAMSGIDLALWDLAGKLAGKPVCRIVTPHAPAVIPAYLSGLAGDSTSARVAFASQHFGRGIRLFKVYFESDWVALIELIDALQAELGPEAQFAVDALWHLKSADDAKLLDSRPVAWLECPWMPEETAAHLELARGIRTPLALGESYRTLRELMPFLESKALGWVQPDLGRSGFTESLRIASAAAQAGVTAVPHLSIALGPQIAAAIHFAAATENCNLSEYNPRVLETANRFLKQPIIFTGSGYEVPNGAGWGIQLDEAALQPFARPR